LKRGFAGWRSQAARGSCRTVEELHYLAEQAQKVRLVREKEIRSKAEAEKKRTREAILTILARDFPGAWKKVDEEACRSCASAYDTVCRRLVDLRDAYNLQGSSDTFHREFEQFMTEHGRRKALVTRLDKVGLR